MKLANLITLLAVSSALALNVPTKRDEEPVEQYGLFDKDQTVKVDTKINSTNANAVISEEPVEQFGLFDKNQTANIDSNNNNNVQNAATATTPTNSSEPNSNVVSKDSSSSAVSNINVGCALLFTIAIVFHYF